ncbi:MAG: hypothetical protein WC787_00940 [Patescibacteria group bacterium]|jgi:hypothetical protein
MAKAKTTLVSVVTFLVVSALAATASADDLADCFKSCANAGKIVCGSDADILTACSAVPECTKLSADTAKLGNDFCNACRQSERDCSSPAAKSESKPIIASKPLTPRELCRKQGGALVDGICYTYKQIIDDLRMLKAALNKDPSKDPVDIKKRIEAIQGSDASKADKLWVQEVINKNMDWTRQKFDRVDFKLDQVAEQGHAQSQRLDLHDRQIADLNQKVGEGSGDRVSGLLGFEVGFISGVHTVRPYDETQYIVGVGAAWLPEFTEGLHGLVGGGIGYAGESANDESLATWRLQVGLHGHLVWLLHLSGGFITDQTLENFDVKAREFYGGFAEPQICFSTGPTACLGLPIALGATRFQSRDSDEIGTVFDAIFGLHATFAYFPPR